MNVCDIIMVINDELTIWIRIQWIDTESHDEIDSVARGLNMTGLRRRNREEQLKK